MICSSCDYYVSSLCFLFLLRKHMNWPRVTISIVIKCITNGSRWSALVEEILSEGKETFIPWFLKRNFPSRIIIMLPSFVFFISLFAHQMPFSQAFPRFWIFWLQRSHSRHWNSSSCNFRGAKVIEKHFDKSDTTIRDHALSATPDEFAQLVYIGRQSARLDLGFDVTDASWFYQVTLVIIERL